MIRIGFKSDPGIIRENNEDFFIVDKDLGLFLVADGLGGHQAGEVASKLAAQTIQSILREKLCNNEDQHDDYSLESIIRESIDRAHQTVRDHALEHDETKGMGTTIVLALYQKGKVRIAHVGDSRAYAFISDDLVQITEDHSLVANLVKAGEISRKKARLHSMKHIISQCIGSNAYFGPDITNLPFDNHTIFLLCTDGLTDMIGERDIRKLLKKKGSDLQACANALVELAKKNGGKDNITLILIKNE